MVTDDGQKNLQVSLTDKKIGCLNVGRFNFVKIFDTLLSQYDLKNLIICQSADRYHLPTKYVPSVLDVIYMLLCNIAIKWK